MVSEVIGAWLNKSSGGDSKHSSSAAALTLHLRARLVPRLLFHDADPQCPHIASQVLIWLLHLGS